MSEFFSPSGEPISQQSLRCSPLAVVHYSFAGHCLTFMNGWGGLAVGWVGIGP